MFEIDDKNRIEEIISMNSIGGSDLDDMISLMKKYVDKKIIVCKNCPPAIRSAHKRLKTWFTNNARRFK